MKILSQLKEKGEPNLIYLIPAILKPTIVHISKNSTWKPSLLDAQQFLILLVEVCLLKNVTKIKLKSNPYKLPQIYEQKLISIGKSW